MTKVTLEVNGKKVSKEVPDHTLLSVFLRDNLNLTGTHVGCDTSQCGACVVHVNGKSIKSCSTLAADVEGSTIYWIKDTTTGNITLTITDTTGAVTTMTVPVGDFVF